MNRIDKHVKNLHPFYYACLLTNTDTDLEKAYNKAKYR